MGCILKMCFALLFALLISNIYVPAECASVLSKRQIQTENETEAQAETVTEKSGEICDKSLSCAWAVYTPFTYEIKYFMKNSCECPENQRCIRVNDDPVITAFVYKCRDKRTTKPPTTTQ